MLLELETLLTLELLTANGARIFLLTFLIHISQLMELDLDMELLLERQTMETLILLLTIQILMAEAFLLIYLLVK